MATINERYRKLQAGYLFPEIEGRMRRYVLVDRDPGRRDPGHRVTDRIVARPAEWLDTVDEMLAAMDRPISDRTGDVPAWSAKTEDAVEAAVEAGDALTEATRYAITLHAKIVYRKVGVTEPLWENDDFSVRDEYDLDDSDSQNFFDREDQSIDRLSESFARRLVAAMLEAC